MIRDISIKNWKLFKDIKIKNVSNINMIGGKNCTGKTSLLEALFLIFDRVNPDGIMRQHTWRGFQEVPIDPDFIWGQLFYGRDPDNEIRIVIEQEKFIEDLSFSFDHEYTPGTIHGDLKGEDNSILVADEKGKQLTTAAMEYTYSRYDKRNNKAPEKKSYYSYFNPGVKRMSMDGAFKIRPMTNSYYISARLPLHIREDAERLGKIEENNDIGALIGYLKIIEPRLKDIANIPIGNVNIPFGDVGLKKKIPLKHMGDGVSRLFSILAAILTQKGGILFVDEIENGLHHSVTQEVWEIICQACVNNDTQLFATTHSYEFLTKVSAGIHNKNLGNQFKYYRLQRDGDNIKAVDYDHEKLKNAIDNDLEVR